MKDWRIAHTQRGEELYNKGFRLIAENISLEEFNLKSRRKDYPSQSLWLWSGGQVWAPRQHDKEGRRDE